MTILSTNLTEKKDMVNATNTGSSLKDVIGVNMKMFGYVIYESENEKGTVDKIVSIKTENGFVGSTSANVIQTVETIADAFSEEEFKAGIPFFVRGDKSKNDRTFLTMELL